MSNNYYRYVVVCREDHEFFSTKDDAHHYARFLARCGPEVVTVIDRNSHRDQLRETAYRWNSTLRDAVIVTDLSG